MIRDLLDTTLVPERILEKEHFPLRHFFIVFEHILLHGYNGKKSFSINSSSNRKDLWPIIDLISRKSTDPHISEISTSTKELTNIRTSLGRVRAWLRLALMQKRLADYFQILCEQKNELRDLYDSQAILLSEENYIITGLLIGLNVLDFNFFLKETVLDYPVEPAIHYSIYLHERPVPSPSSNSNNSARAIGAPVDVFDDGISVITNTTDPISSNDGNANNSQDQHVSSVVDQKNYLEEMNRKLQ